MAKPTLTENDEAVREAERREAEARKAFKERLNFDTLFAENKILTDSIRSSFKRPAASKAKAKDSENADPQEIWKSGGWMDDLCGYLEGLNVKGKDEQNNEAGSVLNRLIESVKSVKNKTASADFENWAENLELSKKTQSNLDKFHKLTNYEYVMDPHFQALSGMIREFKDITEECRYDELDTGIKNKADKKTKEMTQVPENIMGFASSVKQLTQDANEQRIVLDKELMQIQIEKLDKEIDLIEEKLPEDPRQAAFLHQVHNLSIQLSEDGAAMLNLERKIAFINRMNKLIKRQPENIQNDLKKSRNFLQMQRELENYQNLLTILHIKEKEKIKQNEELIDNLKLHLTRYAKENGIDSNSGRINLNKAAKEDVKIAATLNEMSRLIRINDDKGNIKISIINKRESIDKIIVNEIIEHENYILNRTGSRDELIKAHKDMIKEENKGIHMSTAQLQEEYERAEKDWKLLNIKGPEKLKRKYSNLVTMKEKLEKLEKSYPEMKRQYQKVNEQFDVSKQPTAAQTNEITEQLDKLYAKREACKGDHSNSPEYERMIRAIESCQQNLNHENMENLQQQAQSYLDAKLKWDMFHLKPTKLRFERLDYAREIIEFAKQNKRLYEPVQLEKQISDYNEAAAAAKSNGTGIFDKPEIQYFSQLIQPGQTITEENMNARIDQLIREAHEELDPKPVKEKNGPEPVMKK